MIRRIKLKVTHYIPIFICLIILASMGTILAQASSPFIKIEAEQGVLNGSVAISQDGSASGGSLISFLENTPPPVGQGTFTESFNTLEHWTFGHWTTGVPGSSNPNSSASVVNARAFIVNADQNYGDATLRADRLYDVRNGGTFTFDVSLEDGALQATGAFIGFPDVAFVDQPLNAPSYYDDNGKGTGPRNGGYYQFFHTCKLPWQTGHARQYINYVETVISGEDNCLGQVTITEGQLNRVEMRYNGNNGWELWASNAGTIAPLSKLRAFSMQIPEVGYFIIGSHNHASLKYSNNTLATANATFDNISYPAGGYSSSFRNGANVVKGAAVTAHISFNGWAQPGSASCSLSINGVTVPFTPVFIPTSPHSGSFPISVEVPLSAVHDGANTITTQGVTNTSNLDLVLTRNTP